MKETVIVALIIAAILGGAVFYIIRQKKKGNKCIGCPDAKNCPSAKGGGCSCGSIKK